MCEREEVKIVACCVLLHYLGVIDWRNNARLL